jgi:hypothetical protein
MTMVDVSDMPEEGLQRVRNMGLRDMLERHTAREALPQVQAARATRAQRDQDAMAMRQSRAQEQADARRDRIALRQPGELQRRLLGEGGEDEDGIPNWLNVQARMGNPQALQLRERLLNERGELANRNRIAEQADRRLTLEEEQNRLATDQFSKQREQQQYEQDVAVMNDQSQPAIVREQARQRAHEYINRQYNTPEPGTQTATTPPQTASEPQPFGTQAEGDLEGERWLTGEFGLSPLAASDLMATRGHWTRGERERILRQYNVPESEWPRIHTFFANNGRAMTAEQFAEMQQELQRRRSAAGAYGGMGYIPQ